MIGQHRRSRALLLAFALVAGPVVVPGAAQADGGACGGDAPCIVVTVDAGGQPSSTTTIGASTIKKDGATSQGDYQQVHAKDIADAKDGQAPTGTASGPYPSSITVAQVLGLAGVSLTSSTIMTVPRTDGSVSVLDAADLGSNPPYVGGDPPLFGLEGTSLQYARPQAANDQDDANGNDFIQVDSEANSGELDITVDEQGTVLDPVIVPPADPQPNQPAQFGIVDADPDATYAWQFGDGSGGQGATPQHTYACGLYGVYVSASDPSRNAYGTSDVVRVSVCPQSSPTTTPGTGHGTGASSKPPTGPDTGSGHGTGHPTSTSHSGGGGGRSTAARTSPATQSTTPPPGSGPLGLLPSGPSGSGASTDPAGQSSLTAPPTAPPGSGDASSNSSVTALAGNDEPFVQGVVIDGARAQLRRRLALRAAAAEDDSPQASRRPGATPFDATILWWLLIPALLGLGAATERRRPSRRPARR